jgi:hypothetical protein
MILPCPNFLSRERIVHFSRQPFSLQFKNRNSLSEMVFASPDAVGNLKENFNP